MATSRGQALSTDPRHWRDRAEEARLLAHDMEDTHSREAMLRSSGFAVVDHPPELEVKNGRVAIPTRPGLGVALVEANVKEHLWGTVG